MLAARDDVGIARELIGRQRLAADRAEPRPRALLSPAQRAGEILVGEAAGVVREIGHRHLPLIARTIPPIAPPAASMVACVDLSGRPARISASIALSRSRQPMYFLITSRQA